MHANPASSIASTRHASDPSTVGSVKDDLQPAELAEELTELRELTTQLRTENARLLRLLELTPKQAAPPGPIQTGFFEAHPGPG